MRFMNITDILSNIGGLITLIKTLTMVFDSCVHKSFYKSITVKVQKDKGLNAVNMLEQQIIERVYTIENLYHLDERVTSLE